MKENSPAVATDIPQNENDNQGKAASSRQTKKSDLEIVRENEEKFRFCPPEKQMDKMKVKNDHRSKFSNLSNWKEA